MKILDKRLIDKTKVGKVRPWKSKKKDNVLYADYLKKLNFRKSDNVRLCSEFLTFKKMPSGHLKLYQAWFCKSKLCPMCNWRRSLKNSAQLKQIFKIATDKEPTGRFLFLTLTQENSTGETLRKDVKAMSKAANRLMRYKKIAKNLIGYVRSLEVTVNDDDLENITYHPHFHLILFMKKEYFRDSKNYIEQEEWTNYWKKALKVDYTPIVHIQAVKSKSRHRDKDSLLAAAEETAKYQVKSTDILTGNEIRDLKVIDDLEIGLSRTRQISFGGSFKKIRKELQLDDLEDGDLINVSNEDKEEEEKVDVKDYVVAKWDYRKNDYYILSQFDCSLIRKYPKRGKKKKKLQVLLP